jgi:hypothetical protein
MQEINHTHSYAARNTPKQWSIHHKLPHHQSQTYIKNWDQKIMFISTSFFNIEFISQTQKNNIFFEVFWGKNITKKTKQSLQNFWEFFFLNIQDMVGVWLSNNGMKIAQSM